MLSFLAVKEKKEQRKKKKEEEYQFVKESNYFPFFPLSQNGMCLEDFDQQPFL